MPDTVPLIDPDGVTRDVPADVAQGALQRGWRTPTADDISAASTAAANERDYGGAHGVIGAIGGGIARGITLGASDLAARAIGGEDATQTLQGLRAEHPYTSGAGEFAGMLLPAALTGGAATPAGIAATIGRRVAAGATREGAGLLGRVAGHAIGAAAEGSLYGGGQYLSETALENKPLSAEGFVGGMGKGALFAAPVGGTFALAGEALQRARSLFPRSQITPEAAAVVKSDASAALRDSLTDGDAMVAAARRRIALADAQAGAAGARTQVTRRVFGGGDPAAIGTAVDATANKAQLAEALGKLETSQAALKDWIAAGGDVDLEASMAGLRAPGLQTEPGVAGGVPVGEFGPAGRGGIKSPEELSLSAAQAGTPEGGSSAAPTEPAPATAVHRKGTGSTPATSPLDDIAPTPEARAAAASLDDIAGGGPATIPTYEQLKANDAPAVSEVPASLFKERGWYEMPGQGEDAVKASKARQAIAEGQQSPIVVVVGHDGKLFVEDGRNRLAAAVEANAPIKVRWDYGTVAGESGGDVLKHGPSRAPAGGEPGAAAGGGAPAAHAPDIERMSLEQVDELQKRLDPMFSELSPESREYVELSKQWDRSVARRQAIKSGGANSPIVEKIATPAPLSTVEADAARGATTAQRGGAGDLEALLRGTKSKLEQGANLNDIGAPARAEYAAGKAERSAAASAHFRGAANEANYAGSAMAGAERDAQAASKATGDQVTSANKRPAELSPANAKLTDLIGSSQPALPESHSELGKMFGIDLAPPKEPVGNIDDLKKLLAEWSDQNAGTVVDKAMRARMGTVADDAAIERLLQKRPGKNVDVGPQLARAAKIIGDHEAASSEVAALLGSEAPKGAAGRAQAYQAARAAQAQTLGASAAKSAQGIQDRALPALGADRTAVSDDIAKALRKHESAVEGAKDKALVSMRTAETKAAAKAAAKPAAETPVSSTGIGGKLADIGTALEVMKALGVHVPVLSAIPVIGPVLGLFLKARAVLSILGRKGGSVGRSTEGLIAATSAATRDRIATATQAILTGAGKGALKLSEISAGPAVTLGYKLFPGDGVTSSKNPQKLYEARMDEIARAQRPGALDHAIADRYQTADPDLHDAIVAQAQRGISFLDSKAPKPTTLPTMLPGDGVWRPSRAALDEWGKYVHAVGDPASVLEDLAKGHATLEGAETLRVVYPELFAEGQRMLLQAAPQMQRTLPYPTRVAIYILYRIPVDGSTQPGHLQYLQQGQGASASGPGGGVQGAGAGSAPPIPSSLTGPIKLGQSTMTSLDQRAGS